MPRCRHEILRFEESLHAQAIGYRRPDTLSRLRAAAPVGTKSYHHTVTRFAPPDSTFPAPLVLPDDELSQIEEGDEPNSPQMRVHPLITKNNRRQVVYVLALPATLGTQEPIEQATGEPSHEDVVAYLQAFYMPLKVRLWHEPHVRFCEWEDEESAFGLQIDSGMTRVRTRESPDGVFKHQLSLSDLLDAAIDSLPADAAALLLLSKQDLFEDEEDDFCCGRAFGGSHVCIVSSARYNPKLDRHHGINRLHSWPASHCAKYMAKCCGQTFSRAQPTPGAASSAEVETAIGSAVQAFISHPTPRSASALSNLWLGRLCKTASHELGHCFGLGHCTLYACAMQGTASIAEGVRQPPYLCHSDTKRLLICRTGADEKTWLEGLQEFCARFQTDAFFDAFLQWLRFRQHELHSRPYPSVLA